jgi:hypothetical protein
MGCLSIIKYGDHDSFFLLGSPKSLFLAISNCYLDPHIPKDECRSFKAVLLSYAFDGTIQAQLRETKGFALNRQRLLTRLSARARHVQDLASCETVTFRATVAAARAPSKVLARRSPRGSLHYHRLILRF